MSYLIPELLIYLLIAAAIGAALGWFISRCSCNRDLTELRSSFESKINTQATELEETKKQALDYKTRHSDILSQYNCQTGDLMLMTSRWQSTLKSSRQLPAHQKWIKSLQQKYQQILGERNDFENLACQYVDMHADANQKIKRLNKCVTDQESYKFRCNEMTGKVRNLNDKVTSSENDIRGLYDMIGQVQSKWRHDRIDTARMREVHPLLEQQASSAKAELHAVKNRFNTELSAIQKQRNQDLAQQNTNNQTELAKLKQRINELTPLEAPSSDNKFGRFMDKVRFVGTSKNNVLGRTYKQISEIKLELSEKERVFVDTCEGKDAIIDDLREQLRTADNRAQASNSSVVQEYKTRINSLESELQSSKLDLSMLREHEHTIEAFKSKLQKRPTPTLKPGKKPTRKKVASKPATELKAPAKGLKIAAATVKDDLQVVKGIGPVMETKLNDFGIYSYEQLGRLKKDDIETLATTLGGFSDRIDRDKWVSQSKKLFKKKYGQKID